MDAKKHWLVIDIEKRLVLRIIATKAAKKADRVAAGLTSVYVNVIAAVVEVNMKRASLRKTLNSLSW